MLITCNSINILQVVNYYMSMIADTCGDVHSYSSFFYPKLIGNAGYSGVRRWTKKVRTLFLVTLFIASTPGGYIQ